MHQNDLKISKKYYFKVKQKTKKFNFFLNIFKKQN
jgi:hypothetical protein